MKEEKTFKFFKKQLAATFTQRLHDLMTPRLSLMPFSLPEFSIPVVIFLGIFVLYMLFYLVYSLFNLFHLVKYGIAGTGLYIIVTVFLSGTVLLVAGSIFLLLPYDWTYTIPLNQAIEMFDESMPL